VGGAVSRPCREATITIEELLRTIDAGRIVDLATGDGSFVHRLIDGLARYDEIVGVDADPRQRDRFERAFAGRHGVRFVEADAERTAFADASFDVASISSSLHHLADPSAGLAEMRRIVRPDGWVIVLEMYRDGQGEPERTHVLLHHWAAAIDRAHGIVHRRTYRRHEIELLAREGGLRHVLVADEDDDSDPIDPATIDAVERVIDRQLERAGDDRTLRARGEEIRRRLRDVGIRGARSIVVVGRV
jgi:SAM-dependent methyltransferase